MLLRKSPAMMMAVAVVAAAAATTTTTTVTVNAVENHPPNMIIFLMARERLSQCKQSRRRSLTAFGVQCFLVFFSFTSLIFLICIVYRFLVDDNFDEHSARLLMLLQSVCPSAYHTK